MQRLFEFIPGIFSWTTLFLIVFLSWQRPVWIAIFIILFDIYWLLKSIYLSLHLRATFKKMQEYLKISWQDRLAILADWKSVHHLVILPMADEPYEVVRETFESLVKTNYPKEKLFLILAIEERAGEKAAEISEKIKKEFSHIFPWLIITKHPAGLEGEIPGKGSNEAWAAEEAKKLIIDKLNLEYEKVLVSVFDV